MKLEEDISWKFWLLNIGLVFSFLILLATILKLSVIHGSYYKELARENKVFETSIPAARSKIVDRKGRILAQSIYQYFKVEDGNKIYNEAGDFDGYKFEGKNLAYELKRNYPYGESTAFVTGYLGSVNKEDIKNNICETKINGNDFIGKGGIESFLDCRLRGVDGKRLIEVDAKGDYIRELGRDEPKVSSDVILSIDAYWQDKIYKMLDGKKATVIISEPKTGKILVFVSSPSFDPNVFSYRQDNEKINQYLNDKENFPMLNRVTSARYHPGSVFKLTMATAGLEGGVIDKETLFEDTGILKVGDYSYRNWSWSKSGKTEGMLNIVTAIKKSNDIFFYKLGEALGLNRIVDWSKKFGYGQQTGVEVSGELSGLVPDDEWKKTAKGESWYLGDTYHLSIGQGFLDVTPLQVNQMTNIVANNGIKCKMSLLKDKISECESLKIKNSTLMTVIEGMNAACKSGGTAWPLFNFKTQLACKTGTAEVGDGSKDTHAWLTAFAPADDPQISITVMVERGGEGSDVAAPIVGDILKEWFNEPDTLVPRYSEKKEVSE
jgi:penicillin-binding protein 2